MPWVVKANGTPALLSIAALEGAASQCFSWAYGTSKSLNGSPTDGASGKS